MSKMADGFRLPEKLLILMQSPNIFLQDPEVAEAFSDISSNPANMYKYKDNPKIQKLIEKMSKTFGGGSEADFGEAGGDVDMEGGAPNQTSSDPSSKPYVPSQPDVDQGVERIKTETCVVSAVHEA